MLFRSSIAAHAVCPYCRSLVVRRDLKIETLGQMAELPPDLSPLQIGAHGFQGHRPFTLVGRLRVGYAEGTWNEWYAVFDDGGQGWLAEAQGTFSLLTEKDDPALVQAARAAAPGDAIERDGTTWRIIDRREIEVIAAEGELPFAVAAGERGTSIDLVAAPNAWATVEWRAGNGRAWSGGPVAFQDLRIADGRQVPGWDIAPEITRHQTAGLGCPACGAAVELRASGMTMSAACPSCATLIDTSQPQWAVIQRAEAAANLKPRLPIGARGELDGVSYEVIGCQRVRDDYAQWLEYLLFNPRAGFVWLVTFQGHWSLVRRVFAEPVLSEPRGIPHARFDGRTYRIFGTGTAATDAVLGEFYWRIRVGDRTELTDFVAPPAILSRERYSESGETAWSAGAYLDGAQIEAAFGLTEPLMRPQGVYLNQPNVFRERLAPLKAPFWIILLVLFLIQAFYAGSAARRTVYQGTHEFVAAHTNRLWVTPPFRIEGRPQAIEVELAAGVDNSWMEFDVDLVQAATRTVTASYREAVEYYHGADSDGPWTEGGQASGQVIPAVAPGEYYLAIEPEAAPTIPGTWVQVKVVRDVPLWLNFWMAAGLLATYPFYLALRGYQFEVSRWSDSDYSPYASADTDDDEDD